MSCHDLKISIHQMNQNKQNWEVLLVMETVFFNVQNMRLTLGGLRFGQCLLVVRLSITMEGLQHMLSENDQCLFFLKVLIKSLYSPCSVQTMTGR